jgi:hypothetical protein
LLGIAIMGGACAFLVLTLGKLAVLLVLGTNDATSAARAEAEVRSAFAGMSG